MPSDETRPSEPAHVRLASGAEDNGLATMLADLIVQNLKAKPHKQHDFAALRGGVAIVAEDADVALTLRFERGGHLTIHDGIEGIPDVTIRGPSEAILALSNLPLATPLGLPIPNPRDREAVAAVRTVFGAMRRGELHLYGVGWHFGLVTRLGRVMSVNG